MHASQPRHLLPRSTSLRARIVRGAALILIVASGCAAPEPELADDAPGEWRRWRGPQGRGISQETGLPVSWTDEGESFRWRTWVPGAGNSSPVVSKGRVFLTTVYGEAEDDWNITWQRDELHRVVVAIDLASGELLWQTSVLQGIKGKVHHTNTRAAPSPVTDGKSVFVSFDGILAAVDFDGNLLWKQDVDPDYYAHAHYGVSTSPVVGKDKVFLMQDREEGDVPDKGWIAAFDKATGEEIWRDEWDYTCCSYTTPFLLEREDGTVELLRSSTNEVVAHDPETGTRLWTAEQQNTQPVPSLIIEGDLLCAPGAVHDRTLRVFRLAGSGTETVAEQLWATGTSVPKIPTPIFYRDRLFVLTDQRLLVAYEPETGDVIWQGRVSPGQYRPSLVAGDGKLYAVNQYGIVSVVDAEAPKFRMLSESSVGEGTQGATPAIADGCLLVRTQNHLVCVEDRSAPEAVAAAAG